MIKKVLFVAIVATSLFAQGEALVNTESLKKGKINPLTEFIGSVKFENSSNLASESNGLVKKIFFEVGDKVKKGQTLISIDSSILDAQIKAAVAAVKIAQVELKNATNDYNRYSALLKKDSIAQKSFDDVYLAYEMAKQKVESSNANLKELQIQKDKKSLKAPYDGIIVEKSVNLNEWVSNGTKIAKIVNTTDLEMTFNLPLEYVYQLDKTKNMKFH